MTHSTINIAIVQYPGSLLSAIYGLKEMFEIASDICEEQKIDVRFSSQLVRANDIDLQVVPKEESQENSENGHYDLVLFPPANNDIFYLAPSSAFINWIKDQHDQGAICASACAAAFILAETGMLKHKTVTTHWRLESAFKTKYPELKLKTESLLINEGDIITAGGMLSWQDLGFEIITQFSNVAVLRELGRYLVVDTSPREQRYYAKFIPPMQHGDKDIVTLQRYIHENLDKDLSLPVLLSHFHYTERTLHRRFIKATGYNPSQYIQRFRVQKACQLLETTQLPFDSIAFNLGYQDANALRKKFINIMGLSPIAFRTRFQS